MKRDPSEYIARRSLTNELGNEVGLTVTKHDREPAVTIHGVGPSSEIQHTWTTQEAQALRGMLTQLLGAEGSGFTEASPPVVVSPKWDVCRNCVDGSKAGQICTVCEGRGHVPFVPTPVSPPVVDDLSPATRRMEQILDAPFVRKVETLQAFERLKAMMPADRARDGMTTIAVRGEDMRALLDAILALTPVEGVGEREARTEYGWLIERDGHGGLRYATPRSWTADHMKALRFARKVDAEEFAASHQDWSTDIRITEHAWD